MRVLKITTEHKIESIEIDGSLESMQEIVGGYIEFYPLTNDGLFQVVCNDEGKINGLEPTLAIFDTENMELKEVICGQCFICKDGRDGDVEGLTDLDEMFLRMALKLTQK